MLLPGLITPVRYLFPLVRYLRKNQSGYGVAAISLRLSIADFDSIVARATNTITQNLLQKTRPGTVVLLGHSHGGRVACEVARRLKKTFPAVEYVVITAGTPIRMRPDYLSWLHKKFFSISKAYRSWPAVVQPNPTVVKKYIGYFSTDDRTIIPECAKAGFAGQLIELHGLSHRDLISPTKMGPVLLKLLENLK